MADKTPEPLTEEESKSLEKLIAKQEARDQFTREQERQDRLASLGKTKEFLDKVDEAKILDSLNEAVASQPDVHTLERLMRLRTILNNELQGIRTTFETYSAPVPVLTPLAKQS